MKEPPIITASQWGARHAKAPTLWVGRPERIVFHHTAGHHPEIANPRDESRQESIRYAKDIQHFHMDVRGWNDSGHNFLVCRNGLILTGRWFSYTAVSKGRMVMSAHCPGQNDQPGIEHEHTDEEPMTAQQFEASAWLCAWIIHTCGMRSTGTIHPHDQYIRTDCPGALRWELQRFRTRVVSLLNSGGPL